MGLRKVISVAMFLCVVYTFLLAVIQLNLNDQAIGNDATPLISWSGNDDYQTASSMATIGRDSQSPTQKELRKQQQDSNFATYDRVIESFPHEEFPTHEREKPVHDPTIVQSVLLRKLKENRQALSNSKSTIPHKVATSKNIPSEVPFLKLTSSIYVYSIFLDTRTPKPEVRLFVLRSKFDESSVVCIFNNASSGNKKFLAKSLNSTEPSPGDAVRVPATEYEMCENHNKRYGGWIYSCSLPPGVTSTNLDSISVALQQDQNEEPLATINNIPLQRIVSQNKNTKTPKISSLPNQRDRFAIDYRNKNSQTLNIPPRDKSSITKVTPTEAQTFIAKENVAGTTHPLKIGVCVPPLYGNVNLQRIVNFVEFCRILGAARISLYINDIAQDMFQYLQEYSKMEDSVVSIVKWNLPLIQTHLASSYSKSFKSFASNPSDPFYNIPASQIIWNRGQLLSIQHCLYTQMSSFDWILFLDVDEMLVPRSPSSSWHSLIHNITTTKTKTYHSSEDNKNNIIYNNNSNHAAALTFESAIFHTDSESQAKYSTDYFQKLRRGRRTDKSRRKTIVRPDKIFELGIHHVSRLVSDADFVQDVDPDTALIHHYRDGDDDLLSSPEVDFDVYDDSALPFRKQLRKATRFVMNYLGNAVSSRPQ